jgi:biotin operon repressor
MSVKALSAVWEDSQAVGADLLVLLAMADWANHSGLCYPSYKQIAEKARVSRASVAKAITHLVELGEIERVTHGHTPTDGEDDEVSRSVERQWRNLYRILLVKPKGQQAAQPVDHLNGAKVAQPVDHLSSSSSETGSPIHPPPGSPIEAREVVQFGFAYKERPSDRPSGRPSEELRAGAAPRRPVADDDDPNFAVILKTAHDAIDIEGETASLADLAAAVKSLCCIRNLNVGNNSALVSKAIDSALWQRKHAQSEAS